MDEERESEQKSSEKRNKRINIHNHFTHESSNGYKSIISKCLNPEVYYWLTVIQLSFHSLAFSSSLLFYLQPVRSQRNILLLTYKQNYYRISKSLQKTSVRLRVILSGEKTHAKDMRERLPGASQARSYTSRAFSPTCFCNKINKKIFRYRMSNVHVLSKARKLFWQSCCFTRTNISETLFQVKKRWAPSKRVITHQKRSCDTLH